MESKSEAMEFQHSATCWSRHTRQGARAPVRQSQGRSRLDESTVPKAREAPEAEEPAQPPTGAREPRVMTKARLETSREARLLRIKLPRMDVVGNERKTLWLRRAGNRSGYGTAESGKGSTAADRKIGTPGQLERGHGELEKIAGIRVHAKRRTGRIRHPVFVVPDGKMLESYNPTLQASSATTILRVIE